jgi:O-antigen ligase
VKRLSRPELSSFCSSSGLYALGLTFFLIPFPGIWTHYSLGAFLAFSLVYWFTEFNSSLKSLKSNWYIVIPFPVYFLLCFLSSVIGGAGWPLIEKRLIFLLLPLIGISLFGSDKFRHRTVFLVRAFVAGLLVITSVLILRALLVRLGVVEKAEILVNTIESANTHFLTAELSFFQHPGYFSMELNLAVIMLLIFKKDVIFRPLLRFAVILFFLVFIFLLSSRAGLLATILSGVYLIFNRMKEVRVRRFYYLLIPAIMAIAFVLILILNPRISGSLKELKSRINRSESLQLKDLEPRTRVWYSSCQLIGENPVFGVGVRELDNKLKDEYRRNNFYSEAFFTLNSHNQFLESQLTFGIAGSFLLIWMILAPFMRKGKYNGRTQGIAFLIIILVHFMFESMLVRQWGILFFVLFSLFQAFIVPYHSSTAYSVSKP